MGEIKSWSFSRWSAYHQCPRKAKYLFVDRMKEPPNPAMDRGVEIHAQAEDYIKGKIDELPADLSRFSELFEDLREQYAGGPLPIVVEDTWAFRADWSATTWDDWAGCRARIKLDVGRFTAPDELRVIDWKTGKFNARRAEEYEKQLSLYALGALLTYPDLRMVEPSLVYLDAGVTYPEHPRTYTRDDIPVLRAAWEERAAPMLNDTIFAAKPSPLCAWCAFGAKGTGHCEF